MKNKFIPELIKYIYIYFIHKIELFYLFISNFTSKFENVFINSCIFII